MQGDTIGGATGSFSRFADAYVQLYVKYATIMN